MAPQSELVRSAAAASLAMVLVWLAGCAAGGAASGGDLQQRVTASDQTDTDRRSRVRLELASLYFGRGQLETALDEVKLALVANPASVEAYNLRGLIYGSLGDRALAQDSFQRALQINPRDADTLHNSAWFQCQQGRFAEAAAQFQLALAQPQYTGVGRTLLGQGVCEARAGLWLEAERSLSKAYEQDPSNPVTAFNLSEVLLKRGELERARFYVRRVNAVPELVSAQTLWLAARIERRMDNELEVRELGAQLRARFPQSPEALQFDRGRFND